MSTDRPTVARIEPRVRDVLYADACARDAHDDLRRCHAAPLCSCRGARDYRCGPPGAPTAAIGCRDAACSWPIRCSYLLLATAAGRRERDARVRRARLSDPLHRGRRAGRGSASAYVPRVTCRAGRTGDRTSRRSLKHSSEPSRVATSKRSRRHQRQRTRSCAICDSTRADGLRFVVSSIWSVAFTESVAHEHLLQGSVRGRVTPGTVYMRRRSFNRKCRCSESLGDVANP